MLVRAAEARDAEAIARFIVMAEGEMITALMGASTPEEGARILLPFVQSPTPSRYALANNLTAEVDGDAAGSIICFPADDQPVLDLPVLAWLRGRGMDLDKLTFEGEPGTYYLSTMGVNPDFRGRGIGSALLAAACERGKELGFDRASLLVAQAKPRVRGLYERQGFAAAGETVIAGERYDRMVKEV